MTESTGTPLNPETMFDTWMKSVNDFWSSTAAPFQPLGKTGDTGKSKSSGSGLWQTGMETWKAIASAMNLSPPDSSSSDMGTFSKMFIKMSEPVFSNMAQMLQQWQSQAIKAAGHADHLKPFDFDSIDTDVLNIWNNFYDNEFRKFLKVPQLGLMREHQEKIALFMDRFNILQATMAEFLTFLAVPFKKTNTDFQEKLKKLGQENKLPRDANGYYRLWLKILEGHYMTLFQSPDYIGCLGKTLTASAAYTRAKKDLLNDLLQQLSIPSSDQMDAVYRELHGLKKRLKDLEKAVTNR